MNHIDRLPAWHTLHNDPVRARIGRVTRSGLISGEDMRHALAAGAVGLGLYWGTPALAAETKLDCPKWEGGFATFEPLGKDGQEDLTDAARVERLISTPYHSELYTAMTRAQFDQAQPAAKIVHGEYLKLRAEWLAARNAAKLDVDGCTKLLFEIKTLTAGWGAIGAGADSNSFDTMIAAKRGDHDKLAKDAKEKIEKADKAYNGYMPRRLLLKAFAGRLPTLEKFDQHARRNLKPEAQFAVVGGGGSDDQTCVIDTPPQRRALDPNKCKFDSQDNATLVLSRGSPNSSTGDVPIAGQPVDKRGITVSIAGSKDSSDLSLSLTDTFRSRRLWTPGEKFQRLTAWGYKVGVSTGGKNGNLLDFSERDDKDRLTNQFDRLDAKTKLSLSLFYADYGSETVSQFEGRSASFYNSAVLACNAAQGKPDAFPSTCEGQQLMAWIFAQKDGAYLHGDHALAFGSLYFAPPPTVKYAKWGAGVSVDIARPVFQFKDLAAGATPTELLAAALIEERKFTYTISPYLFFRMPGSSDRFGWTLIPSVTLKREYGTEDAVTICPAATPGEPFSIKCGDPFLPQRPERKTYLVPGLEGRFIWSGARIGRFYFPQFGLAPKASFDTDAERWEFTLPGFFAVDSAKSLTAGLSLIYRTGGENDMGEEIKGETGVAIVIGKTFSLDPF